MKMNKKKIAVVSLVICLIAIISCSSLAWFTASDTVVNNLTFDTGFSVDLYEIKDGKRTGVNGIGTGFDYDNLVPGAVLSKQPIVVNKSTNIPQYIRMTVTVDKAFEWAAVLTASDGSKDLSDIFAGFSDELWERVDEPVTDGTADTITYTYYLKNMLNPGDEATLFTGITIPKNATLDQAKSIGTSSITITAEAIQASNLGVDDAVAAFALVD